MIVEDKYMGYDYERHEYYLKEQAIIDLTPLEDAEIKRSFSKLSQTLKLFSQRIYAYIYSKNSSLNRTHVQFKIYKNSQGERQAILDAILQYILGAFHGDKDLNPYYDEKNDVPPTVYDILKSVKLFNLPKFIGEYEGDF